MKVYRYVKRGVRRLTAPARSLPALLCIGAMRSGTSSLAYALARHPEVAMPTRKEVQFFDMNFERGVGWYRAFFPMNGRPSVDLSPTYMTNPETADRAGGVVPEAAVIALLRDPVERAWSLYRLRRRWGTETRDFEQAIARDLAGEIRDRHYSVHTEIPYLDSGRYGPQLRRWSEVFGERLFVFDAAEMFADPEPCLDQVQALLGVTRTSLPFPRVNVAPSAESPTVLTKLYRFFDESDEELVELTGRRFSWM